MREVALATSEAWVRAALLDGPTGSEQRLRAVAHLRETPFEAGVEWYLGGAEHLSHAPARGQGEEVRA